MLSTAAQVVQDSVMAQVLNNPALTYEQKADVLISVCEQQLDQSGKNFIVLLAEKARLPLLPEIALQFEQLKHNNFV